MGRARKVVAPGREWTPRQVEVLGLLARGRTNPEIAEALRITLDGARYHVREILGALGVETREEAGAFWRAETGTLSRTKRAVRSLALLPAARWSLIAAVGGSLVAGGVLFALLARDDSAGGPPEAGFVFQIEPVTGEPFLLTVSAADGHELGRAPQYAFAQATAGRYVVLQSQGGIDAMAIDGSSRRHLYSASAGKVIVGASPSPDGARLAVTERIETGGEDTVVVVEVETGAELERVDRDDPRLSGFLGDFGPVLWHRGDSGFTISSGGVQVEGEYEFRQSFAYLDPKGGITVTVVDASGSVSPDGEKVLHGAPAAPGCMGFVSTHELKLQSLATGKVVNSVRDDQRGLRTDLWINPDRPIYLSLADAGCSQADPSTTAWELPERGKPVQQTIDPYEQLAAARPSLDIEVSCGSSQRTQWGDGGYSPYPVLGGGGCRPFSVPMGYTPTPGNERGKLYVRGRPIAEMTNFMFIGAVTVPRP